MADTISEIKFRALLDHLPGYAAYIDAELTYRFVNRQYEDWHGLPRQEIEGRPIVALLGEERFRVVEPNLRRALSGEEVYFHHVAKDRAGRSRTFEGQFIPDRGPGGRVDGLYLLGFDVTERRQAETALAEREQLLRTLGDNLPSAMVYQLVVEPDGRRRFTHVSAGVEALSGVTAAEVLRDPALLYTLVHEDDLPALARAEAESFARLSPFDIQVRKRLRTGEVRWSHLRSAPRRAADGRVVWDGVELDITAQKQAEEARATLQRRVQEAQRLESLGVLAGGIAHDFNNLLTGILGNAHLAAQEAPPGSAAAAALKEIEQISHHAADLCRQMLAYAGKARYVPATFDLNGVVADLQPLLRALAGGAARLDFRFAPAVLPVVGDAAQLQQVLQNLVTNAAEAILHRPGTITVRTDRQTLDGDFLRRHAPGVDAAPGEYAVLAVEDTGGGMTEEVRRRLFEPFFTTKFTGRGLGLAAVQGIVRGHAGFVTVESELGQGCRLSVFLPAAER